MGHLHRAKEEVYRALAGRLDKNPLGAPYSETLMKILYCLYTGEEAEIGSRFPLQPVTLDKLAQSVGMHEGELAKHLNSMADKGLVVDVERKGKNFYMLSPVIVGFFEYTFMRVDNKLPLKELAELFEEYHNQPGVAEEFFGADTKVFQTWSYESQMPVDVKTEVLTYESASEMIRDAGGGALSACYCRHQAYHLGRKCDAPMEEVCTSLGKAAAWLIKRGFARPASTGELLQVLDRTEKLGLVHLADNVQNNPAFLCHCCGCCCVALRGINEHQLQAVHPSNFVPRVDVSRCAGCGLCVARCHVRALDLVSGIPGAWKNQAALLHENKCLGCGACIPGCAQGAISFTRRNEARIPPLDKKEQMLRIAKEKRKTAGP
jgi:ferredoxin/DNA-binding transcriptional ArsR family regulator